MEIAQVARQCRLSDVHPTAEQELPEILLAPDDVLGDEIEDRGLACLFVRHGFPLESLHSTTTAAAAKDR
jgi:hypothetical protein